MRKNYNYTRRKLFLPEYGRHIQEMVDSLLLIEDRQERTRQAKAVIAVMGNLNPTLRIEGFLLTMYDARLRLSAQVHDEVRRHFGDLVFNTVIARNVRLSEAPSHGMSVLEYDRNSKGAKNYTNLAKELIRRQQA